MADANAYIEVAFFKSYHDDRGREYSSDNDLLEQAIIRATDYVDNRWGDRFKGSRLTTTQALEFPRKSLRDRTNSIVEGIPAKLKQATAEYALRAIDNELAPDPEVHASGNRVTGMREKVGPIEEEFSFAEQ